MRRHFVAAGALTAALALPALAAAKGPESASVSGPGLDRSLAISVRARWERGRRSARSSTSADSSRRCTASRPIPRSGPSRKARSARLQGHLRRPRAERHQKPRRPGRLPVRKAGAADLHEARPELLGHAADARRLVPRIRRSQARADPGGAAAAAPRGETAGFWTPGAMGGIAGAAALLGLAFVARPLRRRRSEN